MKNLLLLPVLLVGATSLAQAQSAIPAGTVSLGGSIGYLRESEETDLSSSGTVEEARSTFRFTPSVGFFVADNLAIGLNAGYTTFGTETSGGGSTVSTTPASALTVGPYVQYYKMFNDQFGVVGTLGAGYAHTSESISSGSSGTVEVKGNGFYTGLTPSVVFFPIPKFAIGASIGGLNYQRLGRKAEDATGDAKNHVSNFGASFGLDQLQFSGTYYFGR